MMDKLRRFIQKQPFIAYPLLAVSAILLCSALMSGQNKPHRSAVKARDQVGSAIGFSLGGVDQQAYMARIEKNYFDFEERMKSLEGSLTSIKGVLKELRRKEKEMQKKISVLRDGMAQAGQAGDAGPSLALSNFELSMADVHAVPDDPDSVYLPLGSFCKGTLLTGVYASADINNPLPVLIALDEGFFGPNQTRIPLQGAFILGKAYGDLVSQRAYIQVVAISTVLPNGKTFEREENLGYVTDQGGELGVRGQLVRNTGRELALTFGSGLLSGGAQSLADQEVTSTSRFGGVDRQVSGDQASHAIFSGLAKTTANLADYYEKQAESLFPAIHVKRGSTVYFVVQKGVAIHGLPRRSYVRPVHVH